MCSLTDLPAPDTAWEKRNKTRRVGYFMLLPLDSPHWWSSRDKQNVSAVDPGVKRALFFLLLLWIKYTHWLYKAMSVQACVPSMGDVKQISQRLDTSYQNQKPVLFTKGYIFIYNIQQLYRINKKHGGGKGRGVCGGGTWLYNRCT